MTRKYRWIPLSILGCIIALLLAVSAMFALLRLSGHTVTTGRYFTNDERTVHFLIDGTTLIALSDTGNQQTLFQSLTNGDPIAVVHGAVEESYPAQTDAYHCLRLGHGSEEDIPLEVLNSLCSLGYIEEAVDISSAKPLSFNAQYIHSHTALNETDYPTVRVIRSVSELLTYYDAVRTTENNGLTMDHSTPLLEAFNAYDDAYFEDHILLLVLLQNGSGSIRHKVTGVYQHKDGLVVKINELTPEVLTWDMAWWHVLIEPEAGVDVPDAEHVSVITRAVPSTVTEYCCYPTRAE